MVNSLYLISQSGNIMNIAIFKLTGNCVYFWSFLLSKEVMTEKRLLWHKLNWQLLLFSFITFTTRRLFAGSSYSGAALVGTHLSKPASYQSESTLAVHFNVKSESEMETCNANRVSNASMYP